MAVDLVEVGLRLYLVTCDVCGETHHVRIKSKVELRNTLRHNDWIWIDIGVLGIVNCICPECGKERKKDGNKKTAR